MSDYSKRAIIIVRAATRSMANAKAKNVDAIGGDRTFTVPLSPTGLPPATHYWCSWALTEPQWLAIKASLNIINEDGSETLNGRLYNGNLWSPENVLDHTGLKTISQRA